MQVQCTTHSEFPNNSKIKILMMFSQGICRWTEGGEYFTFDGAAQAFVGLYRGNCSYVVAKHTSQESDFEIRRVCILLPPK